MSFGYSVGDFITTIRLAEELRKRFVDAPSQYQAIRADVKTLSGVIVDIEDALPHRKLSQQQEQQLSGFRKSCENVLVDLKSG